MQKILASVTYKSRKTTIKLGLLLVSFTDENGVYILYAPHLDLSGYGHNLAEAKESLKINIDEFFNYSLEKKVLQSF
jgi:hypothetical protein